LLTNSPSKPPDGNLCPPGNSLQDQIQERRKHQKIKQAAQTTSEEPAGLPREQASNSKIAQGQRYKQSQQTEELQQAFGQAGPEPSSKILDPVPWERGAGPGGVSRVIGKNAEKGKGSQEDKNYGNTSARICSSRLPFRGFLFLLALAIFLIIAQGPDGFHRRLEFFGRVGLRIRNNETRLSGFRRSALILSSNDRLWKAVLTCSLLYPALSRLRARVFLRWLKASLRKANNSPSSSAGKKGAGFFSETGRRPNQPWVGAKSSRADPEEQPAVEIVLEQNGKRGVLLAARRSRYSQGHLFLKQEHRPLHQVFHFQQNKQNLAGDVVGQIAGQFAVSSGRRQPAIMFLRSSPRISPAIICRLSGLRFSRFSTRE